MRAERLVLRIFGLGACIVCATGCWATRHRVFILPRELKHGWVAVVYEQPGCSPIVSSAGRLVVRIPPSGVLCTSSVADNRWARETYEIDGNGTAEVGRMVHKLSTVTSSNGSCRIVAYTFWYGAAREMKGDPIEVIRRHVPGCGQPEARN
jgi:hypothetical protein